MPVDTRDKRASCIGIDGPYRRLLPNPDAAAETVGDRQQLAYKYSGISSGAAASVRPWFYYYGQSVIGTPHI